MLCFKYKISPNTSYIYKCCLVGNLCHFGHNFGGCILFSGCVIPVIHRCGGIKIFLMQFLLGASQ